MNMEEMITRFMENMADRVSGPMSFRFIIQPAVALYFGIRDGAKDARQQRQPYLWLLSIDSSQRGSLLREGWRAVAKVFFLALALDIVYQLIVLHFVYPGEAIVTAFAMALIPYIIVRGPANRIARTIRRH